MSDNLIHVFQILIPCVRTTVEYVYQQEREMSDNLIHVFQILIPCVRTTVEYVYQQEREMGDKTRNE